MDKDPRYDVVGSSSLREELFNTYLKTISSTSNNELPSTSNETNSKDSEHVTHKEKEKERRERAVREREEAVRRERGKNETELARARGALSREEGRSDFLCAFLLLSTA